MENCVEAITSFPQFLPCVMYFWAYIHTCMCKLTFSFELIPHCLRQVPMGGRSSNTKNWGRAVARGEGALTVQLPLCVSANPRCEVSCQGVQNWSASLLCSCFIELVLCPACVSSSLCFADPSLTVEKAVWRLKVNRPLASLPSFCNK